MLHLKQVAKSYPAPEGGGESVRVLRPLDLEIRAGDCLTIVGPSGSGKSTLLHLMGLLTPPSSGSIAIEGTDVLALDADAIARLRSRFLGFIFQAHHLLPQCTALENVLLPTLADTAERQEPEAARRRAEQLLERVGLGSRLTHRPAALSGGECQRVAVARALINRPRLVLADEPTGSLDAAAAQALGELLLSLNREEGTALVIVTHSPDIARLGTRRYRMNDGRLE